MSPNFWGYLIEGLTGVLSGILNTLPIGNTNTLLGGAATVLYFAIAPLLIIVGSFVDLSLLAAVIGMVLALEAVKAIIAGVRWIYKLIPAAS
jgi:hypothetical protein